MNVSLIIPCYNAEKTVEETLQSVFAQTYKNWEVIFIDDGSTDGTLNLLNEFVKKDKRISIYSQNKLGVSAARNKGLELANFEQILFLDADDLILPEFLEIMIKALVNEPEYDAVYCSWSRMVPSGEITHGGEATFSGDIFHLFVHDCLFAIHACVIKKQLIVNAGGFDTSLSTCEDWDLWQRIARTGVKFKAINKALAIYRMRTLSASMDAERLFIDGFKVLTQGYSKDLRVNNPHILHINGLQKNDITLRKYYILCWTAGLAIGVGKDPTILFQYLRNEPEPSLEPEIVAHTLLESSILPACKTHAQWNELWLNYEHLFVDFLNQLETQSLTTGLSKRVQIILERHFLKNAATKKEITVGSIYSTSIEISYPIQDIVTSLKIERLICDIYVTGKFLGKIELPVFNGFVPSIVLRDAIAHEFAWDILGEYFSRKLYKRNKLIWKLELKYKLKGKKNIYAKDDWRLIHNNIGWSVFLQEIWQKKFWPEKLFYAPPKFFNKFKSKKSFKNDWFIVELTERIPNIKLNGKEPEILITMGGEPVDLIKINKKNDVLFSNEIISHITLKVGIELCFVVVRESIIGKSFNTNLSLVKRLKKQLKANKDSDPVKNYINKIHHTFQKTKSLVIGRYDYSESGTSAFRYSYFPSTIKDLFTGLTDITSISISTNGRSEKNILYAPGLILKKNYDNFKSELNSSSGIVKGIQKVKELPILMYHRVSPSGSNKISRYRVTPEEFEEQLKYLKDSGYHSINLNQWGKSAKENLAFSFKPILLTFDDGYKDFKEYAYPLLKKYDFSAVVFIVTDNVGETNNWDVAYGESISLMDWNDIIELKNYGIHFGAHSHTHPPLTSLSPTEIITEALNSKKILQQKLSTSIDSFAYPYGDFDPVVKNLIGSCGFNFGLTCYDRIAKYDDSFLALPRIEVIGETPIEEFSKKLTQPVILQP